MVWLGDGRVGTFDCGFDLPLRQWLEITGTEGIVSVPEMWLPGPHAEYTVTRTGQSAQAMTVPGEDHRTEPGWWLVRQAPERLGERGDELGVERVAHLGTRQRDPRHRPSWPAPLDPKAVRAHRRPRR